MPIGFTVDQNVANHMSALAFNHVDDTRAPIKPHSGGQTQTHARQLKNPRRHDDVARPRQWDTHGDGGCKFLLFVGHDPSKSLGHKRV